MEENDARSPATEPRENEPPAVELAPQRSTARRFIIAFFVTGVLLVVSFFAVGAFLPDSYHVSRSRTIDASPEEIYRFVGNLDTWTEWSPWNPQRIDGLEVRVPGRSEGVGAVQELALNGGVFHFEITSAEASRGISYEFDFHDEQKDQITFDSSGIISFQDAPGGGTEVTWIGRGTLEGFTARWGGLFLRGMMGEQFEEGLAELAVKTAKGAETTPDAGAPKDG